MPHLRQQIGKRGEELAVDFLGKLGIFIIDRNYHFSRYAEIDLIGQDQDELVFIEVKTRSSTDFGRPEEAVNKFKQEKIRQAAESYILRHPQLSAKYRFDVVAITYQDSKPQIQYFKNINLTT